MKHIFLSYSRKDTEVMVRVRDTLRAEGFVVWTDEELTPGTPQWHKAIEQAISDATGIVVLLSPDSKASQWVANEIAYAYTNDVAIFPILVRGEEREAVPIQLISVQRVDIRTRFLAQMQELVDTLQDHLKSLGEIEAQKSVSVHRELSDRERERIKFWIALLERSKTKTRLFSNIKPKPDHWMSISAGKANIGLNYTISKEWAAVEVYIDHGTAEINKRIFDNLLSEKDQIEREFGDSLEWRRLDDRRASRIIKFLYNGGLDLPETWPTLQNQMIEGMIRLDNIFRLRLTAMKL